MRFTLKERSQEWRWWFALIPTQISGYEDSDEVFIWLEWYRYRKPCGWQVERQYKDYPAVTYDTGWD